MAGQARSEMNMKLKSDLPGVSIIVLNHNGKEFLKACLGSLQETDYPGPVEIILVDNGSTDGSSAFVENKFPEIVLIPLHVNSGFAAGNNVGCKQASHDIVATDAYAATLFGLTGADIPAIRAGVQMGLGTMDLSSVKVEEISV